MAAEPTRRERRLDPLGLAGGLGTVLVAAYILGDGANWGPALDIRWIAAAVIALIGLGLVVSALRG